MCCRLYSGRYGAGKIWQKEMNGSFKAVEGGEPWHQLSVVSQSGSPAAEALADVVGEVQIADVSRVCIKS